MSDEELIEKIEKVVTKALDNRLEDYNAPKMISIYQLAIDISKPLRTVKRRCERLNIPITDKAIKKEHYKYFLQNKSFS